MVNWINHRLMRENKTVCITTGPESQPVSQWASLLVLRCSSYWLDFQQQATGGVSRSVCWIGWTSTHTFHTINPRTYHPLISFWELIFTPLSTKVRTSSRSPTALASLKRSCSSLSKDNVDIIQLKITTWFSYEQLSLSPLVQKVLLLNNSETRCSPASDYSGVMLLLLLLFIASE